MVEKRKKVKKKSVKKPVKKKEITGPNQEPVPVSIPDKTPLPPIPRNIEKPKIDLTVETIKRYINPNVTDQEAYMFLQLCKSQNLNPFIKEAYLIKYSKDQREPATIVVGKDVFTKRAYNNQKFNGFEAGLTIQNNKTKEISRREGSLHYANDEVIKGGWGRVYVKGIQTPFFDEVSWDEYVGTKKDGTLKYNWKKMPGTMMRKVALVHALREAFPETFQGLYDESEMNVEIDDKEKSKPDEAKNITPKEKPVEVLKYVLPKNIMPTTLCEIGPYKTDPVEYGELPIDQLLMLYKKSENKTELEGVLNYSLEKCVSSQVGVMELTAEQLKTIIQENFKKDQLIDLSWKEKYNLMVALNTLKKGLKNG